MDYRISGHKLNRSDALECQRWKFGKIQRIAGKDWLCCNQSAVSHDWSVEAGDRYEIT